MESPISEEKKIMVYERRRRGISTGKLFSNPKQRSLLRSESSMDKSGYERRRKGRTQSSEKISSSGNDNNSLCSDSSKPETDETKEHVPKQDGYYYACVLCNGKGSLLRCDNCLRTYHIECLSLESSPEGYWKCVNCCDGEDSKPTTDLVSEESERTKKVEDGIACLRVSSEQR